MHLSAGELLRREEASKTAESELLSSYLNTGKIVPVEITCRLLMKEMRKNPIPYYLIDGFPRNENNMKGWFKETKGIADVQATIVLHTDKNSVIERLSKRGRYDDKIETIERRFKQYYEETVPVINELKNICPIIEINANGTDVISINRNLYNGLRYLI